MIVRIVLIQSIAICKLSKGGYNEIVELIRTMLKEE